MSQLTKVGWWDVPNHEYLEEQRAAYERERAEVRAP